MAPCALVLCFLLLGGAGVRGRKRLRFGTSWNSGENWSLGHAPLPEEVAVMGAGGATVALPSRVAVRALLLAADGALLLPSSGRLAPLGPAPTPSAPQNRFVRGAALSWLDAEAWEREGQDQVEGEAGVVPHAERVPCQWERVQLPPSSFALRLPPLPLAVGAIFLGPRPLAPHAWARIVADGRFVAPPRGAASSQVGGVSLGAASSRGLCAERLGCPCAPPALAAAVERSVCALQRPRCGPPPPCDAPVKPRGHCCPLCGAFLELRMRPSRSGFFNLAALRAAVRTGAGAGVAAFAHALPEGARAQVVVAERPPFQGRSLDAALALRAALLADASLGVEAVTLTASGPPTSQRRWLRVAAPVLGTLALAAAAFATIFLLFSGWRTLMPCAGSPEEGAFVFARFENAEADSEAVEVLASPLALASAAAPAQSFDNPLYKEKDSEKSANKMQYTSLQDEETSEMAEASGFKRFGD